MQDEAADRRSVHPPDPVHLYHITHVDNLGSIVGSGALLSHSERERLGLPYRDIAHGHIRDRRGEQEVEIAPGGVLNDYVPWYFAPRSPMLYAIHKGGVARYSGGQGSVVHLVSRVDRIDSCGCRWIFTDGHAVIDYAGFYDDLDDLDKVDWALMTKKIWRDTQDDPNRRFRRQAEFLVHRRVPWRLVLQIGVQNKTIAARVKAAIKDADHKPEVLERAGWYY